MTEDLNEASIGKMLAELAEIRKKAETRVSAPLTRIEVNGTGGDLPGPVGTFPIHDASNVGLAAALTQSQAISGAKVLKEFKHISNVLPAPGAPLGSLTGTAWEKMRSGPIEQGIRDALAEGTGFMSMDAMGDFRRVDPNAVYPVASGFQLVEPGTAEYAKASALLAQQAQKITGQSSIDLAPMPTFSDRLERIAADVLNRAFNDGVALTSAAHPSGPTVKDDQGLNDSSLATVSWECPVDVTPAMLSAGVMAYDGAGARNSSTTPEERIAAAYRAMHALAPVELVSEGERRAIAERDAAYGYLRRLFENVVPSTCEPLPDLMGLCTQIDNLIAGLRMDVIQTGSHSPPVGASMAERNAGIAPVSSMEFSVGLLKGAICEGRLERQVQLDQRIDAAEIEAAGWIYDALKDEWRIAIRVNAMSEQPAHDYHGPKRDGKAVQDEVHERFHKSVGDVLAGRVQVDARRQMQEALKNAPKDTGPAPMPKGALGLGEPSDFSTETLIVRTRYRVGAAEMDMRGVYGSSPVCTRGFGEPDAPAPVVDVSAAPTARPLPVTALRVDDDRRKVGWRPDGEV